LNNLPRGRGRFCRAGLPQKDSLSYRARVLAVDEIHDIAVIALRGAHDLPVGRFGNSARLRIGDDLPDTTDNRQAGQ
jgi:S1-C subfamily serine protease